jgi:cation:H+ antiporter
MAYLYILYFLVSAVILYFSGEMIVRPLMKTAKFLKLTEFVVAFFVMAFAASLPNLAVGIISALNGIPELSLGEIMGGNLIDLTLAVVLAVFFSKSKEIDAGGKTIQTTSLFTIVSAMLPLILVLDGKISRPDGMILIIFFFLYVLWLFSKKERFSKIYNHRQVPLKYEIKVFIRNLGKLILGIALLLFAADGMVRSASFFAEGLGLSIGMIGLLIVALGNALPEIYFAVISARRGETGLILGDLMGAIITTATFVLGTVAVIRPIIIPDFSPFAIARIFLVMAAAFFLFFVKSDQKISWKEAVFLMLVYFGFLFAELTVSH